MPAAKAVAGTQGPGHQLQGVGQLAANFLSRARRLLSSHSKGMQNNDQPASGSKIPFDACQPARRHAQHRQQQARCPQACWARYGSRPARRFSAGSGSSASAFQERFLVAARRRSLRKMLVASSSFLRLARRACRGGRSSCRRCRRRRRTPRARRRPRRRQRPSTEIIRGVMSIGPYRIP